ncbi:MAG: 16S rRNA (adenine(1518)-N(6)/adenine(1519)-N(6))-dimethyltransferase RsmA [Oligoflexia bacterium]|nr:16S rRNA (adenine(1518)-N(6)/adenine(1519)-N(6))-dimethyltransferase RsmA [Oligoflexia bacterium]
MNERSKTRGQLRSAALRPSRGRGQNFIVDPTVINRIIEFGRPAASQNIVEIGPGLGALTKRLSEYVPTLTAIEVEAALCEQLSRELPSARFINRDVREVAFNELGDDLVVFGNLPYSLSTDILFHLIENGRYLSRAVLMLQREFAERVAAPPGGRDYGVLSISAQLWCDARLGAVIDGGAFHPRTKVESRLLELVFLKQPRFAVEDLKWFRKVVQASFLQRRRMIKNSLQHAGFLAADQINSALAQVGILPTQRAETVSIEQFVALSKALSPVGE